MQTKTTEIGVECFGVTEKQFGQIKTTGISAAMARKFNKTPIARPVYQGMN
jgi:hypothetical protein